MFFFTLLASFIFFQGIVLASESEIIPEAHLGLTTGYRQDNLSWNIAGDVNGENPNVLSELKWDDVNIWQVRPYFEIDIASPTFTWFNTYIKGEAAYGWIFDGKAQDSDFDEDNRTSEIARVVGNADDGNTLDLSIVIGPRFTLKNIKGSVTPLFGFSYIKQDLMFTNGRHVIPSTGPFLGLNSTYETVWKGPWAGLEVLFMPSSKWLLGTSFGYHWLDYYAEADWNLRKDLKHPKSFDHEADGNGINFGFNCKYLLSKKLTINVLISYKKMEVEDGIDRTYTSDGLSIPTKLNKVEWDSSSINFGLEYQF